MNELMLDTANMEELEKGFKEWPICGVTTNPTILKKEGGVDIYERLAKIKTLCGKERSLHIQVVSTETEDIIRETHYILDQLGKDVYIKIPVSPGGLPAIKALSAEGINITATAIYSTMQGILATLAKAKYIAVYYNRMENNCTDPCEVISGLRAFIDDSGNDTRILAASFKNVAQVVQSYASGAHGVTVGYDIIQSALGMASIGEAIHAFTKDFEAIHGTGANMMTIAK